MKTIRGHLTWSLLIGAGLLIALMGLFLERLTLTALQQRFDDDLLHRGQTLITLTKVYDEGIELDFAGEFMPEFEEPGGPEFFEIWLADGSLLERSESLEEQPVDTNHFFTAKPIFTNHQLADSGKFRLLKISFLPQQEDADIEGNLDPATPDAAATLLLGRKRDEFDGLLARLRYLVRGSLLLLLVGVVFLVRFSVSRGLKPLEDIGTQLAHVNPDQPGVRIQLGKPVLELDGVVSQLNGMLERQEQSIEREKRFTSDVAHELRTPLAELRSLTEVGLKDPDDRAMILDFLSDIRDISLEMQLLVTNLLELSRCDSGVVEAKPDRIDLHAVIDKSWRRAQANAQRRNVQLSYEHREPMPVRTDRHMLEQIVQNLINNAVKHAPRGATIHITTTYHQQQVGLVISNPAPNLKPEDMTRLFERFWQKDSARTGGASSGLGLSLVAAMTNMLNIKVATRLDAGLLFFELGLPGVNGSVV